MTPPVSPATSLPPDKVQKIAKAAQEFEAMALGQMLAPIFNTVESSKGPFGGGAGEEAWKPMMVTELAKHLARHGGLGLARPIMQQMIRMQEAAQSPDATAPATPARGRRP